jgi:hypothetical protein
LFISTCNFKIEEYHLLKKEGVFYPREVYFILVRVVLKYFGIIFSNSTSMQILAEGNIGSFNSDLSMYLPIESPIIFKTLSPSSGEKGGEDEPIHEKLKEYQLLGQSEESID